MLWSLGALLYLLNPCALLSTKVVHTSAIHCPCCDQLARQATMIRRSLYTAAALIAFEEPTRRPRAQVDHTTTATEAVPCHAPPVASHGTTEGEPTSSAMPTMVIRRSLHTAMMVGLLDEPTPVSRTCTDHATTSCGGVHCLTPPAARHCTMGVGAPRCADELVESVAHGGGAGGARHDDARPGQALGPHVEHRGSAGSDLHQADAALVFT
jgi:hypothetical protein